MTTAAVIQARMGSTRLPGKVMREIAGRPMLGWVVERASRISGLDRVVVATSQKPADTPLVEFCRHRGVPVYRGPEEDVLGRYLGAAERFDLDTVVRITGDCPLLMPEVSGRVLDRYEDGGCDYASNILERTYPRGLDTEVFGADVLAKVDSQASSSPDREHVTLYIRRHPDEFDLCNVTAKTDWSDLRWTVDEQADLMLIRRIYELLTDPYDSYAQVLNLWNENPELREINSKVRQRSFESGPCLDLDTVDRDA